MLEPLSSADLDKAADLLVEGFPERTPAFWQRAIDALKRHGGNGPAEFPPAFLWLSKGKPVGVALTPAVVRRCPEGALRRIVNISSWYVHPDHRWRAPLMLKKLTDAPDTVLTDLTPSPSVRRMLPQLGFRPINRGTRFAFLPAAALHRGRGERVLELPPAEDPPVMGSHRVLGCVPLVVEGPAGSTVVIYRRARVRGVPAADLVYVESHRALAGGFSALSRHLLGRGFMFLRVPALGEAGRFGTVVLPTGVWYARGEYFHDRTDVVGSELTLFDL